MLLETLLSLTFAATPAPERTHDIVPEDYFSMAHISEVAPSPSGKQVVWAEQRWQDDLPRRNKDLWIVDSRTKAARRLTFDAAGDGHPVWSADGAWIYFGTARKQAKKGAPYNGKYQVWRIRPDGTDLGPVTRIKGGIEGFELTEDGTYLYYTKRAKHHDKDPWKKLRKSHNKLKYGKGVRKLSELWRLNLKTWRSEQLTKKATRYISQFTVSPSGDRVAMITVPSRRLIDNEGWSWVQILDLRTRELTRLKDDAWRGQAPSPYGWLSSLAWSDDSKMLALRVDFDGYPGEMFVVHLDGTKTRGTMRLPRKDEFTLSGGLTWRPGSNDLCVKAIKDARDRIYCVRNVKLGKHGATAEITASDKGTVHGYSFSANGKQLALSLGTIEHAPEVYVLPARGAHKYTRLTNQNPQTATWKLPTVKTVRWKNPDGTEVEGILELPPGYDGKSKLPLMVEIHGGPTSASRKEMRFWIYGRTLLAARGWALLSPNYRGSTGYGDKFLTDLIGKKNDVDVSDILSGVDAMVAQGIADPDRMAVMGWSNGGYLTNCIITKTDRFKAAISGAGVVDTAMQWMIEDTPGHVVNFSQGLPWAKAEAMRKSSPLYDLHKVKTPTLIHVGANDARVPVQHSRALFRGLDQYLDVPVELIEYPGEPHGLGKKVSRKAKLEWDMAWLDHWVLGKKKDAKK